HPEVPLVSFLGLVHLGIAGLVGILGRERRIDDGRIDNRAGGHLQALRRQVSLHLVEQPPAQIVRLEQMAEAAHRGFVGDRLAPEIDPDEIAHYPRIVERFLDRRVRQVEPLLQKVYSQHPLDPDWRTAVARLRIERLDQPTQRRPRHDPLHLGQKRWPAASSWGSAQIPWSPASTASSPNPTRQSPPPPLYHNHRNPLLQR